MKKKLTKEEFESKVTGYIELVLGCAAVLVYVLIVGFAGN